MSDEEQTVTIPLHLAKMLECTIVGIAPEWSTQLRDAIDEQTYTRPDEPTNLGAVVVDEGYDGNTFVRVFLSGQRTWMNAGSGATFRWSELAKPRVKSHGWDGSDE